MFGPEKLTSMAHNEIFLACYSEQLANKPNSNATAFIATASGPCGQMSLSWTSGAGEKRLIIGRAGAEVNKAPTNGIEYSGNTAFGMGDALGDGNYVVYNGTGNSAALTNVGSGPHYFKIYEYNGSNFSISYLLTGNASANGSGNGLDMSVSTLAANICKGSDVIVTASGADSYTWSPGTGLNTTSGPTVNAKPAVTTTYTVKGSKSGCEKSMNVVVKVENCNGIVEDKVAFQKLNIFPNPGNGIFSIKVNSPKKENLKLEILNTLGQVVSQESIISENEDQIVNLNYLPNGIYLCRLVGAETQQLQKLIVQK